MGCATSWSSWSKPPRLPAGWRVRTPRGSLRRTRRPARSPGGDRSVVVGPITWSCTARSPMASSTWSKTTCSRRCGEDAHAPSWPRCSALAALRSLLAPLRTRPS
jgi:hypothetical protein